QRARGLIAKRWGSLFSDIDVLLTPTVPQTAARLEQDTFDWEDGSQESVAEAYVRLCAPANVTGLPALTVPFGKDHQGLPIGVQIMGEAFDDAMVLQVGRAVERPLSPA
ncbi:MAG: amidase family protein, partial [Vreelandella alkaliphila]